MTATPRTVLVVDRPSAFRDALARAITARGASVLTSDDSLDALSRLSPAPDVMLIGEDAGPPGGAATCRIARRKLKSSSGVYLLSDGPAQVAREGDVLLRDWGADALAVLLLRAPGAEAPVAEQVQSSVRHAYEASVPALRVGELLLLLAERSATGRLVLTTADSEREVYLLHGLPVFARSSMLAERLGKIAIATKAATSEQLEHALEHARLRGARLAESLIAQGTLSGGAAFSLLADQLVAQLAAACEGPKTEARFFAGDDWASHVPILRLHPLTAVLAAVERSGAEPIDSVIDELGDRALVQAALPPMASAWLRDLGLDTAEQGVTMAPTVRRLRDRLVGATAGDPRREAARRSAADAESSAARGWASALTVTLLRSGAVRVAEADGDRARAALSSAASAISAAGAPIAAPPAAPLKEPSSELGRQLHAYLHGPRPAAIAAMAAVRGPAAEARDPALSALLGLYVRCKSRARPRAILGVSDAASASDVRRSYFRLVEEADPALLSDAQQGPLAQCKASELRTTLDEALAESAPFDEAAAETEPAAAIAANVAARKVSVEVVAPRPAVDPPLDEPPKITKTKISPIDWDEDSKDVDAPASAAPATVAEPERTSSPAAEPSDDDDDGQMSIEAEEPPDPRLLEIEPLLARGKWDEICDLLGPPEKASALVPALGLIYAIARKETAQMATSPTEHRGDAEELAIRSVSAMFGVKEGSTSAIIVAKRTLRLLPVAWTQRKAPTSRRSLAVIVFAAILGGAVVGLLVSQFY